MKNKTQNFLGLFLCCASFSAGWFTESDQSLPKKETIEKSYSSEMIPASMNAYEALRCPTESQFQEMTVELNLQLEEGKSLDEECGDSSKAKLSKVLLLMKSLKISPPAAWPPVIRADLSDLYAYFKKNVAKFTLDLNQKDSLAYNRVSLREIYLSQRFFDLTPLDGVAILFHEARHSAPSDTGHFVCEAGDLPRSDGACDREFSLEDQKAGAYSYGTLFSLALSFYSDQMTPADRQFLLLDALTQLGARFNVIPEALAQKADLLVGLTEDHQLKMIHPFIDAEQEVKLTFPSADEKPVAIEFSPSMNGLFITTNKMTIYTWSPMKGLQPFFPELFKDRDVLSLARVRVPFNDITYYTFIEKNQSIGFIEYSPKENKRVVSNYERSYFRKTQPSLVLQKIFLGLFAETVFISEDGKVYLAPHFGNEPMFRDIAEINQSQNVYLSGTGGAIYDSLYLVEKQGALFSVSIELAQRQEDDGTEYRYRLEPSSFEHSKKIQKFQQGIQVNAALDEERNIVVWDKNASRPKTLEKVKFKDFVLIQNSGTKKIIARTARSNADFVERCEIIDEGEDFWFGWGIG
ncbi:MAG: hypothetical protein ACK5P5_12970, partial [Pseudobdellovibrionaceae bacterium]